MTLSRRFRGFSFAIFAVGIFSLSFLPGAIQAQTLWTGADPGNDNITDADNWDNGLPTSALNLGTINVGANVNLNPSTLSGYFIKQDGGTVANNAFRTISGGEWTLNGGLIDTTGAVGNAFRNAGGNIFTMNGGTVTAGSAGMSTASTGIWNINGGAVNLSTAFQLRTGGVLNMTGGSITTGTTFGGLTDSGIFNINGGTVSVGTGINIAGTGFQLNLGGTNPGSITAELYGGTATRNTNFLPGTKVTLTLTEAGAGVTSTNNWAPTDWGNGILRFNGQTGAVLGLDWTQASDPLGLLPGGYYFVYDNTLGSRSLSLAAIPEPGTLALLLVGALGTLLLARRRSVRAF